MDLANTFFKPLVTFCGSSLQYLDWPELEFLGLHWKYIIERLSFLHSIEISPVNVHDDLPRITTQTFHAPNLKLLQCKAQDDDVLADLSDIFRGCDQMSQSSANTNVAPFPALRQLFVPVCSSDVINPILRHRGFSLTEIRLWWDMIDDGTQARLQNLLKAFSSFCPNLYRLSFALWHWQYFPFHADTVLPDSVGSLALHCMDSQTTKSGYDVLILGLERITGKGLKNVEFDSRNVHDLKKNHAKRWQRIIGTVKARGWNVWIYDAYGIEEVSQEA
jgi:hypothetical protein